ncbi:hypothetical protein EDB89DRAFT_1914326 [Lactarius sanguifluus]|nr:hypothetical protein EDB89DRAFT_1914326 [Lactarius sanguifluus]
MITIQWRLVRVCVWLTRLLLLFPQHDLGEWNYSNRSMATVATGCCCIIKNFHRPMQTDRYGHATAQRKPECDNRRADGTRPRVSDNGLMENTSCHATDAMAFWRDWVILGYLRFTSASKPTGDWSGTFSDDDGEYTTFPGLVWSTVIHRGGQDRSNWSATTDRLKLKHDLCAKRTGNNAIEWIFSEWSGEAGGGFLFLLGRRLLFASCRRSQVRFDRCVLHAVLYLTAQKKKKPDGSTCEIRGRSGANWTARLLAYSMAFPSSVHDPRICHRDATPQKQKEQNKRRSRSGSLHRSPVGALVQLGEFRAHPTAPRGHTRQQKAGTRPQLPSAEAVGGREQRGKGESLVWHHTMLPYQIISHHHTTSCHVASNSYSMALACHGASSERDRRQLHKQTGGLCGAIDIKYERYEPPQARQTNLLQPFPMYWALRPTDGVGTCYGSRNRRPLFSLYAEPSLALDPLHTPGTIFWE